MADRPVTKSKRKPSITESVPAKGSKVPKAPKGSKISKGSKAPKGSKTSKTMKEMAPPVEASVKQEKPLPTETEEIKQEGPVPTVIEGKKMPPNATQRLLENPSDQVFTGCFCVADLEPKNVVKMAVLPMQTKAS